MSERGLNAFSEGREINASRIKAVERHAKSLQSTGVEAPVTASLAWDGSKFHRRLRRNPPAPNISIAIRVSLSRG
jgi:hypothetical protein